jgi:hypothetical protein
MDIPKVPRNFSIENPELPATAEDAIRRLILPELYHMKAEEKCRRQEASFLKHQRKNVSRDGDPANIQRTGDEALQSLLRRGSHSCSAQVSH